MIDYNELKKLKPRPLVKELKTNSSKELYSSYKELSWDEQHSKVGTAMWSAILEVSGSK
jgi:hypothetical protein|tara:strand:+ start:100 stop:276 length:177 start_codon:yes stop_codon:yes gene_type:complete